jgi:uncharacterized protein
MEPYVHLVQTLFDYARAQFKDVKTFFFHNTIYDKIWKDPPRRRDPYPVDELVRLDPATRIVIVGDASMAPYELMSVDGSIHIEERTAAPSYKRLQFISETFSHAVWLNPVMSREWAYTRTITMIREIFPMYELTIDGLEEAVTYLMSKN